MLMTWRLDRSPGELTLGEATPAVEKDGYYFSLPAPDGHTLARMRFGELWFVDTRTGRETPRSARFPDLWSPQWTPDSRRLLTTGPDGRLRIWDPATGRQLAVKAFPANAELRAAFRPDGRRVYVLDGSGTLTTLDTATLRPVYDGVAVGGGVNALLPHPRDGSVLVLKLDGSFLRVRPDNGKIVAEAPAGTLASLEDAAGALSPDGSVLATTDAAHRLRLLDVESLDWISPGTGPDASPAIAYAPDGSQFASVQTDRIGLWDGRTGDYQASLPLPALSTYVSVSYLPDSSGLVIASVDGRTWTASTRTGRWPERACAIAGRNLTEDEWTRFFPSRSYHATCPEWPSAG
jgi:WD40 repeat protein